MNILFSDLEQEKGQQELLKSIETFSPKTLQHANTEEKNPLPTKEVIDAEKQATVWSGNSWGTCVANMTFQLCLFYIDSIFVAYFKSEALFFVWLICFIKKLVDKIGSFIAQFASKINSRQEEK